MTENQASEPSNSNTDTSPATLHTDQGYTSLFWPEGISTGSETELEYTFCGQFEDDTRRRDL